MHTLSNQLRDYQVTVQQVKMTISPCYVRVVKVCPGSVSAYKGQEAGITLGFCTKLEVSSSLRTPRFQYESFSVNETQVCSNSCRRWGGPSHAPCLLVTPSKLRPTPQHLLKNFLQHQRWQKASVMVYMWNSCTDSCAWIHELQTVVLFWNVVEILIPGVWFMETALWLVDL